MAGLLGIVGRRRAARMSCSILDHSTTSTVRRIQAVYFLLPCGARSQERYISEAIPIVKARAVLCGSPAGLQFETFLAPERNTSLLFLLTSQLRPSRVHVPSRA